MLPLVQSRLSLAFCGGEVFDFNTLYCPGSDIPYLEVVLDKVL
jgi:hypothetical protein